MKRLRWSMQSSRRQTLGGKRLICFTSAWIAGSSPAMTNGTNGKERKKRFGGETPTDARFFCRAGGHGRCPHPNPPPLAGGGNGRGQHIYRRSTAVLVPRSLSSQGTQHQAFASWDAASLLSGRYPPHPSPAMYRA